MPETSLVVIDPGHFHATLVQQQMYPELSPVVRVYAPLGPDLIDYLSRIARYNRRPQRLPSDRGAVALLRNRKFADSPLEEAGFEPSVPRRRPSPSRS